MNLLSWIVDSVVGFVKRNPIFCLIVFILALGAPSLLAGIASLILYVVVAFIVLMFVLSIVLRWRIGKLADGFGRQQQNGGSQYGSQYGRQQSREGDVRIHINNEPAEKRINEDVGDYVDFVEEKNNDGK